ncbi:MAG: PorV/PorQ family protein [Ignavibacteriae bacterium]|nr:PorV/PorQ family protein [Ignavibacteriota bacterium]
MGLFKLYQRRNQVMLKIIKNTVPFFLLVLIFCGEIFAGRTDKAGGAAASELLIPVGSSSIGNGSSDIAFVTGANALYWNPAGLARTEKQHELLFSHMGYFADIGVEYFAGMIHIENMGTLGLGAKILSVGDIPVTTADQPDGTGETASPTFTVLSGAYSRMITDKISFGVSANYIIEKMEQVSATGLAFTAGLQYEALGGVKGLCMGVAIKNIGPKLQYDGDGLLYSGELDDMLRPSSLTKIPSSADDLPSTIEIGLGYRNQLTEELSSTWTVMFQNNNYSADEYRTGIEVEVNRSFYIRGGYVYSVVEDNQKYIFGPTLGLGTKSVIEDIEFQFDYAYRSLDFFSANHSITLTLSKK